MALVRRVDVMDRALGAAVDSAVGGVVKGVQAQIPQQAPAAEAAGTGGAGSAESPASPSSVPVSPAAWVNDAQAAAVASKGAGVGTVLFAFILVAVGAGVAYALNHWGNKAEAFKIGNATSAYAALVVFSAAVERFLEPFSNLLPGGRARNAYEQTVAALTNGHPATSLRDVAAAKARMDRSTANRTVLMWALATGLATAAAGASGFYLLHMVAASGWDLTAVPDWVDALVTGLVVGTGTKPLHDLIVKAQNTKN
jgi:hypothetical protein